MKNNLLRPDRTAKVDARCTPDMRRKLETIAAIKDAELSDIIREAVKHYIAKFEQQTETASVAA